MELTRWKRRKGKDRRICPICGQPISYITRIRRPNQTCVVAVHSGKKKCTLWPENWKIWRIKLFLEHSKELTGQDPKEHPQMRELYETLKKVFEQ
jgi:hypothetical protein